MNDKITIKVCPHHSLGYKQKQVALNQTFESLSNFNVDYYFDGQKLNPKSQISQIPILDGDFIQTYEKNKPMYQLDLCFKMVTGQTHKIIVDHVWTLTKTSRILEQLSGINSDSMKFIFAGRVLDKKKSFMNDSCIMKGSTIHVLMS